MFARIEFCSSLLLASMLLARAGRRGHRPRAIGPTIRDANNAVEPRGSLPSSPTLSTPLHSESSMPSCISTLVSRCIPRQDKAATLRRAPPPPSNSAEEQGHLQLHYAETCCGQPFTFPPKYSDIVGPAAPLPLSVAETETLEAAIDGLDGELRKLSMSIHEHPEIAWKECRTHDGVILLSS